MLEDNQFEAHSAKQWGIISSDEDLTIAATGTQFGKSIAGSIWIKRQIHTFTDPGDNFLLAAPTYKIMNQSMVPYFLRVMEGLGSYNMAEALFEMPGRRRAYLRTETDPDSIVGIPNLKAGWLDEAGKLRLYFWENYQARSASKGARTLLTTSPYARNWLYRQYIKPNEKAPIPGVKIIRAASWENPYHTLHDESRRQAMRFSMDPRRFDMVFGGEWGQMSGLVYDCWDDDQNLVDPFQLPQDTRYFAGIDWGYTDPFVLKVRAITTDGRHYGVSEFYKTGQTISDIIEVCKQKKATFGIKQFYCDPSEPGQIEELKRNGIPAQPADNDIRRGIDLHYELIKTRRYKEFRGACPHSSDEREVYHYPEPEDLGPDDDSKELLPVDQSNHAMDVDRYLTLALYRRDNKLAPKVPSDRPAQFLDQTERLEFLKRTKRNNRAERWS